MSLYSLADLKDVNTIQESCDLVNVETHLVQLTILKVNIHNENMQVFHKYMKFDDYLAKKFVLGLKHTHKNSKYCIKGCTLGKSFKIADKDILVFNTVGDILINFWNIILRH